MKIQKSSGSYSPTPAGNHQAVIVDVLDYGFPQNEYKGEVKAPVPVTELVFQILETNNFGERYEIRSKRQNISWGKKSNFPKFLAQIIGQNAVNKIMDSGECTLDDLIGRNVWLVVEHIEKGNGADKATYPEITNIMEFNPKQGTMMEPDNYTRICDRDGYRAPNPSIEDENAGREVSTRPVFVRANGETYSPPDWMVYREDLLGATAGPAQPIPQGRPATSTVPLPQKSASEPMTMGQVGQIRSLAALKLGNDGIALTNFVFDGFGKDITSLTRTEALDVLSQLRGMKDISVGDDDEDDPFEDSEDDGKTSAEIASDARLMEVPAGAPKGNGKAANEAYGAG